MQSRSKIVSRSGDRVPSQGRRSRRRFPVVVLLLLVFWSGILGWGLSQAAMPQSSPAQASPAQASPAQASPAQSAPTTAAPIGTVDPVPETYQLGQQLYLENCATCHVGLPPAVMPDKTWAEILPDASHYGVQIKPLTDLSLQIMWRYISHFSRALNPEEQIPYRLPQSRYFKALHPKVEFAQPVTVQSCVTCHPAAAQFNYRLLTPAWENSP
jgi:mono/diheme cytochrome c family protein